jgi:hypothetical protein
MLFDQYDLENRRKRALQHENPTAQPGREL